MRLISDVVSGSCQRKKANKVTRQDGGLVAVLGCSMSGDATLDDSLLLKAASEDTA